ncbi:MAG: hypothetical protein R3C45_01935 [Phycisphaerales bacterium]
MRSPPAHPRCHPHLAANPHGRLLGLVEDTLERSGLHVVNHAHALTRDGQRYFGLLELRNGHPVNGHALVVGECATATISRSRPGWSWAAGPWSATTCASPARLSWPAGTPSTSSATCPNWSTARSASWATCGVSRKSA